MPPAARLTDMHTCPMVTGVVPHVGGPIAGPCSTNVTIGGLPAARVTDKAVCVGPPDMIAKGSPTVQINNLMAARIGDNTVHGGVIVMGFPTVIIGEIGMGGAQGATLKAAAKSGAAFCET
ncbi:MAG: type VI secretion protein [Candidatus Angelobacter sp. Gp1-AA117]|nr:MAG: type VI secretion protein [Candidatus Angelobacter sp. Gp1-AA117]